MPAPLTRAARDRLQAAADAVAALLRPDTDAAFVIATLVEKHGATFKPAAWTNTLRCAGVTATCTWSEGQGLLDAWRRLATLRLAAPAAGNGQDR